MATPSVLGPFSSQAQCRYMGGKAAALWRLRNRPLAIPPWFCLSSQVFQQETRAFWPQLTQLWQGFQKNLEQIEGLENALKQLAQTLVFPEAFSAELEAAIQGLETQAHALFPSVPLRFALRSSARGEDQQGHSFAGLFESYLHKPKQEIKTHILACWQSAFSLAVLRYLSQHQLGLDALQMAVLVQLQIPAEVSGVYFAANPDGNLNQQVLVAGYGLGSGVVDGQVPVDTWLRDRFGQADDAWQAHLSLKTQAVQARAEAGLGLEPIPEPLQAPPCLTLAQRAQILAAGQQISHYFGGFQDIEWCYFKNKLWILQSRPISTLPPEPYALFDNANIVESYPGIVLPLSASLIRRGYAQNFYHTLRNLGFTQPELQRLQPVLNQMIQSIQGRLYYHLPHWQTILQSLPGLKQLAWKSFSHLIQRAQTSLQTVAAPAASDSALWACLKACRIYPRLVWKLLRLKTGVSQHQRAFQTVYTDFCQLEPEGLAIQALLENYDVYFNRFIGLFGTLLLNDLWLGLCSRALRGLLPEALTAQYPLIYMDLISQIDQLESHKPLAALEKLVQALRGQPAFAEAIAQNPRAAWQQLQTSQSLRALFQGVQAYLKTYGMRGPDELKLEKPSLQDEPWRLLRRLWLLKQDLPRSIPSRSENALSASEQAWQELQAQYPLWHPRYHICRWLKQQIHRALHRRELGRLNRTRKLAAVRRLFRALGRQLVQAGQLQAAEDIYYLEEQELLMHLHSPLPLQAMVEQRRLAFLTYAQKSPRDILLLPENPADWVVAQNSPVSPVGHRLQGVACASGDVKGPILKVWQPQADLDVRGKILVCASTDPGWVLLMSQALGLIVERGNLLSHAAIMARELNLPTVVGVSQALQLLEDGEQVHLIAQSGDIHLLDRMDSKP